MDSYQIPVFPFEIIELIADQLVDSRPIYLTNRRLHANSTDRAYWESRGDDRIRTHLPKIPTEITLGEFAEHGNLQMVKFLHSIGEDITDCDNEAVQLASRNGHLSMVKFLHSVGADVAARGSWAIILASYNGHIHVVKFLHSVGADITTEDNYAVRCASANKHFDVVEFLISNDATLH